MVNVNQASEIACSKIVNAIRCIQTEQISPVVVALDGGSGAGKTTLAEKVASHLQAAVVPLDDFYAADIPDWQWDTFSVQERLARVFDWQRVRIEVLEPLRAGKPARWRPFDFAAGIQEGGTYGMSIQWVERQPAPVIILEGAYAGSPWLADLIDLAILVEVSSAERHRRIDHREEALFLQRWHAIWDAVEAYYFTEVRPPASFDLRLGGSDAI